MIYRGPLKRLEHLLLRTSIAHWSYLASWLYHDVYWYQWVGRGRERQAPASGASFSLRVDAGWRC